MKNNTIKEKFMLGTAQFGSEYGISNSLGKTSKNDLYQIIEKLDLNHMRYLDTAAAYGNAEKRLGEFELSNWKVISKFNINNDNKKNFNLKTFVKKSIDNLCINQLYGLLFHNVNDLLGSYGDNLYEQIVELKENKIVNKIGVSIYNDECLEDLLRKYKIDIIQCPISIIDQRLLASNVLKNLKKQNIEIHARSIFLQGLLTTKKINKLIDKGLAELNINWNRWLKKNEIKALDACINFVLNIEEVDKVIFGIETFNQLNEILNFKKRDLPEISDDLRITDKKTLQPNLWN